MPLDRVGHPAAAVAPASRPAAPSAVRRRRARRAGPGSRTPPARCRARRAGRRRAGRRAASCRARARARRAAGHASSQRIRVVHAVGRSTRQAMGYHRCSRLDSMRPGRARRSRELSARPPERARRTPVREAHRAARTEARSRFERRRRGHGRSLGAATAVVGHARRPPSDMAGVARTRSATAPRASSPAATGVGAADAVGPLDVSPRRPTAYGLGARSSTTSTGVDVPDGTGHRRITSYAGRSSSALTA